MSRRDDNGKVRLNVGSRDAHLVKMTSLCTRISVRFCSHDSVGETQREDFQKKGRIHA